MLLRVILLPGPAVPSLLWSSPTSHLTNLPLTIQSLWHASTRSTVSLKLHPTRKRQHYRPAVISRPHWAPRPRSRNPQSPHRPTQTPCTATNLLPPNQPKSHRRGITSSISWRRSTSNRWTLSSSSGARGWRYGSTSHFCASLSSWCPSPCLVRTISFRGASLRGGVWSVSCGVGCR